MPRCGETADVYAFMPSHKVWNGQMTWICVDSRPSSQDDDEDMSKDGAMLVFVVP